MHTERDLKRCLHFLGMVSSQAGDGLNAAEMLQRMMGQTGITFDDLYRYAHSYQTEFQYAMSHFQELKNRAERIWTQRAAKEKAQARDDAKEANAWKFDQTNDPGPEWTWVNAHTSRTANGQEHTVRGHWRNSPRRKPKEVWRNDPNADPGSDFEWIADHTRWFARDGKGKIISVHGYWRRKLDVLKKAA